VLLTWHKKYIYSLCQPNNNIWDAVDDPSGQNRFRYTQEVHPYIFWRKRKGNFVYKSTSPDTAQTRTWTHRYHLLRRKNRVFVTLRSIDSSATTGSFNNWAVSEFVSLIAVSLCNNTDVTVRDVLSFREESCRVYSFGLYV
jgi:tRNA threonylcarbamoyladenosine modification (KEOPS) complex  Pcc1 subunit